MKVTNQSDVKFVPIVITLETKEEVEFMYLLMNVSYHELRTRYPNYKNVQELIVKASNGNDTVYKMWRAFDSVAGPRKLSPF